MTGHWLIKSEPTTYGIDHLKRDGKSQWTGVRNFQARTHLLAMAVDDPVLFYHSSADPTGVAGVAKVVRAAYPDASQFDPKDKDLFDPTSRPEKPKWYGPDVAFVSKLSRIVTLEELKASTEFEGMLLTSGKASRLSVQPVEKRHFDAILRLGR